MTRLEIAARILAGWAANPNVSGKNEEAAAVALSLADALLTAAGETPGDQYAAGFRAAVDRAAKVAESVPYVGGVKGDVAWREACDAIRALAPAAPGARREGDVATLTTCQASRGDGECVHAQCPSSQKGDRMFGDCPLPWSVDEVDEDAPCWCNVRFGWTCCPAHVPVGENKKRARRAKETT